MNKSKKPKILFIEDESHFLSLGIEKEFGTFGGYWKLTLGFVYLKDFDVVVSTLQHSLLSRMLIEHANYMNKVTVLLVDGIFEWNNSFHNTFLRNNKIKLFEHNIYDYVYLCSDNFTRNFLKGKDNVSYKGFYNKRVMPNRMAIKTTSNNKKKFLISFANKPCFSDIEKSMLKKLISELENVLNNEKIEFDFRIFDSEIQRELCIDSSKNKINGSIDEIISDYSAVISTPSSVCLEVMSRGIPLAQLYYRDTPLSFQSAWTIHSSVDFKKVLYSMLNPSVERIKYQNAVVNEYIGADVNLGELKLYNSVAKQHYSKKLKYPFFNLEIYWRLIYEMVKNVGNLKPFVKFIKEKVGG